MRCTQEHNTSDSVYNRSISRKLLIGDTQSLLDYTPTQAVADYQDRLADSLEKSQAATSLRLITYLPGVDLIVIAHH